MVHLPELPQNHPLLWAHSLGEILEPLQTQWPGAHGAVKTEAELHSPVLCAGCYLGREGMRGRKGQEVLLGRLKGSS